MSFCVRIRGALVAENLRLVWVDRESHFLGCFLEFIHHIPQLFFGGCEQHHVVGKSQGTLGNTNPKSARRTTYETKRQRDTDTRDIACTPASSSKEH